MKKTLLRALALVAAAATVTPAAATCMNMQAPAPGTSWGVGPMVTFADGIVRLRGFQWMSGIITTAGVATAVVSNHASGSPTQELNLNNINLVVRTLSAPTMAKFNYADFGGNVNLMVNGAGSNTGDLDASPATLGGVAVTVTRTNMFGFHFGTVYLDGSATGTTIDRFGMGGQEFFVDDVCW